MSEVREIIRKKRIDAREAVRVLAKINPMLEKVSRYEDLVEISDFAKVCLVYADLKDRSSATRNLAAQIHLRAERKLGDLLRQTKPANGKAGGDGKIKLYERLNITRMRASRSQRLADMSDGEFGSYLSECEEGAVEPSINGAIAFTRENGEVRRSVEAMQAFKRKADDDFSSICEVHDGSPFDILECRNIAAVVTAPPSRAGILDEIAMRVADVPVVAVVTWQPDVAYVIDAMREKLTFRWIIALETKQTEMQAWKINSGWRPVVVFGKSDSWMRDSIRRDAQAEMNLQQLFTSVILNVTDENDLVFDPFVDAGESAVAAVSSSRRFLGMARGKTKAHEIIRDARACLESASF